MKFHSNDRLELLHVASLLQQADATLALYVSQLEKALKGWKLNYNERQAEPYGWEYNEVSEISDVLGQVRRKLEYLIETGAKVPEQKSTLLERLKNGQPASWELELPPDFWADPEGGK